MVVLVKCQSAIECTLLLNIISALFAAAFKSLFENMCVRQLLPPASMQSSTTAPALFYLLHPCSRTLRWTNTEDHTDKLPFWAVSQAPFRFQMPFI